MLARAVLVTLFWAAAALADPTSLVAGDPLACFNRIDGAGTLSTVAVNGMPFLRALHVKTGAVPASANAWDIRPRCFSTLAARQDDVVAVSFWMRTITAPDSRGLTSFVLERNDSPYTKSVTYTAASAADWKLFEVPFTMAETYAANAYNFSFWVTFPNQEIEIGGLSITDYGPGIPFSQLGLSTWPYAERAADAPWRATAAARIERYRKGDLAVVVKDDSGKAIPGAQVHVMMKRHAFGFGTAVAGDILQSPGADGQNYRSALKKLFNKTVTENVLKWPPFESWGGRRPTTCCPGSPPMDSPWCAATMWFGLRPLTCRADVQNMLKASPVDANALRARVNKHIADVMAYSKGKVTEWDVLNEPFTNKDLQAVLGDSEMTSWFRQARAADPGVKLYINDYSILESGGYDLQHINGYARIIQSMLDSGAPIDGIGLQSHFDSNLTPPSRVLELIDQFAAFGKDLQVTEFDVSVADEQVQADYTRDFLTICFSHPAMKGFMIWGFWEGAHWKPVRRHDPPQLVHQAKLRCVERSDLSAMVDRHARRHRRRRRLPYARLPGRLRCRSHHRRRYEDVPSQPHVEHGAGLRQHRQSCRRSDHARWRGQCCDFSRRHRGAGGNRDYFRHGLGPAALAPAQYVDGRLPTSAGETRVLFDGTPAPMIYTSAGQVSAIVPYSASGSTRVQVEYQGTLTAPVLMPVAAAAPGIFACPGKPSVALAINASAGGVISCNGDFVPPSPGSVVTFYVTGDGVPAPAIEDGRLPAGPPYPAPAAWTVNIGGIDAPRCAATFAGLVYAGVTQVNVCIPEGVSRTAVRTHHFPSRRRVQPGGHHRPALITLALILKG